MKLNLKYTFVNLGKNWPIAPLFATFVSATVTQGVLALLWAQPLQI